MVEQSQEELLSLLDKVAKDPRTRRKVIEAFKEVEPNWQVPADVQVEALKEKMEAKLEEDRIRRETDRINARLEKQRQAIVEKYGEDAVKSIEDDIMKRHGTADYELAGRIYAAEQPPPDRERRDQDVARHGAVWRMPEIDLKSYNDNPKLAAKDAAYKIIDEFRARK